MTVELDHIGIAVGDIGAALSFYKTALGLDVDETEEVPSQGVRAHFLRVGTASLELLEATAENSPIGRFVGRRGRGSITSRCASMTSVQPWNGSARRGCA